MEGEKKKKGQKNLEKIEPGLGRRLFCDQNLISNLGLMGILLPSARSTFVVTSLLLRKFLKKTSSVPPNRSSKSPASQHFNSLQWKFVHSVPAFWGISLEVSRVDLCSPAYSGSLVHPFLVGYT